MKKVLAILLALAMVFCFAACGGEKEKEEEKQPAKTEYTIGVTGPLTGPVSQYGIAVKNGAEIAVKEINAKGEIKINFIMEDDEHDGEKAANAYNSLKDKGMQIMMGTVTSAPAEVTAAEAYNDRIFYLTPSASSPNVTEGKDNVFQMCFTDPNQGVAAATYMKSHNVGTAIYMIYQNDSDYSKGIRETFNSKAKELGLNQVGESSFIDGDKDFSVQLAAAKAAGADVLFLPMYYQEASLILAQAKTAGYEFTFFGVDGMDGILTLEGFDPALAEGVALLTPFDATAENCKAFTAAYEAAYGETPNQFAADAYDCIYAIAEALKATKATPDMDAAAINDLLVKYFTTDFKFDGLTGQGMTWSANGEVSKDPNAVIIQNGVYVSF